MSKIYLNIQEQVQKNKDDIKDILTGAKTLADFGIKVVGFVTSPALLPTPTLYSGNYGDAYAVGNDPDNPPFHYYVFTRPFVGETDPQWFVIGVFPQAGPQGETGATGKGIVSIQKIGTVGVVDTYQITYSDGTTFNYEVTNGLRGASGTITGASATVDDNVGTPSVEVSALGTPEERSFTFAFHNLKGVQGEKGDPGAFFILAGQVASSSLLPDADDVDANKAYLVGASAPYDVYAILSVGNSHYWINLGPVAVQQSDTKVGSLTFSATGTLSAEVLDEIVNTTTADFIKIGDRYFVKQSTGHYYALKRDSGEMLVYGMTIDLSTGAWEIVTETMVDIDTAQTITGVKTFSNGYQLSSNVKVKTDEYNGFNVFIRNSQMFAIYNGYALTQSLRSGVNGAYDIGSINNKFRDSYFTGQVYAQNTFNVINATDIVSNTLTQAQYDLITNGKPTLIKGTLDLVDSWCFPGAISGNYYYFLRWGKNSATEGTIERCNIHTGTKVLAVSGAAASGLNLKAIASLNGKNIPAYPTTNAGPQVLTIAANGGALSWEQFSGLVNPMSAAGDIIVGGATGTPTRLAKGTAGQSLRADNNGVMWGETPNFVVHKYMLEYDGSYSSVYYSSTIFFDVISKDDTDVSTLYNCYDQGIISLNKYYPCSGNLRFINTDHPVYGFRLRDSGGNIVVDFFGNSTTYTIGITTTNDLTDTMENFSW